MSKYYDETRYTVEVPILNTGVKFYPVSKQIIQCELSDCVPNRYSIFSYHSYKSEIYDWLFVIKYIGDKSIIEYFKSKKQAEEYCKKHSTKKLFVEKWDKPRPELKPEPVAKVGDHKGRWNHISYVEAQEQGMDPVQKGIFVAIIFIVFVLILAGVAT